MLSQPTNINLYESKLRFLLLFIPPLLITIWFFNQNGGFLNIVQSANLTNKEIIDFDFDKKIQDKFNKEIDNIDAFLKIPTTFLRYNIYIENRTNFQINNQKYLLPMSVRVGDEYIHQTESRLKKFNKVLKNPKEIAVLPFSVSFTGPSLAANIKIIDDTYKYGIRPTNFSFLIVYISSVIVVHAFYFLVYKWKQFIMNGNF